jgi:rhodanese-related sulfurtransferase
MLLQDEQLDVIDVRTPAEYEIAHIEAASNVPLDALDPGALAKQRKSPSESPVYVVCQSGARSRQACEKLCEAGVVAVSVEGGTPACERAGLAVKRGRQVISLERQVRIAAGRWSRWARYCLCWRARGSWWCRGSSGAD